MKVTEERFIEFIEDIFEKDIEEMELTDSFREYDEWDSITQLGLVASLSDEFGINLSSEELDSLISLDDLLKFINNS